MLNSFIERYKNFRSQERGASSIEYAIIVVLIAAVIVAIVAILGGVVFDLFDFPFPS